MVICNKGRKLGTPFGECAVLEGQETFPWAKGLPCSTFWSVIHRPFATGMLCERWLTTPTEPLQVAQEEVDQMIFHTAMPAHPREPSPPLEALPEEDLPQPPRLDAQMAKVGEKDQQQHLVDAVGAGTQVVDRSRDVQSGGEPSNEVPVDCGDDDCDSWVLDIDCAKAARALTRYHTARRSKTAAPLHEDENDNEVFYDAEAYLELGSGPAACSVRVACSEEEKSLQALRRCNAEVLETRPDDFFEPGQERTCKQLWQNLNRDGWVEQYCDRWDGLAK